MKNFSFLEDAVISQLNRLVLELESGKLPNCAVSAVKNEIYELVEFAHNNKFTNVPIKAEFQYMLKGL